MHQNDCVVPINEAIVTNVCGDGDCPFHGMLFFTYHDDYTHDLKTPRARTLREMTCKYMQNNPEDKHGHTANFTEHSGEITFQQECIQNFRELDAGREFSERKVPLYTQFLRIEHLNEFEKYLAIMSQTSEYPSLVKVCAVSRVMEVNTVVLNHHENQQVLEPLACYRYPNTDNCICILLHRAHFYAVLPNKGDVRSWVESKFGYNHERISYSTWRSGLFHQSNLLKQLIYG